MIQKISATFFSLRFRDFRLLWLSQFSTSMGVWMDNVTRGWLMYELTDSPFLLGLTGAVKAVPMLLFGLLAGVIADKYGRKPQMLIFQIINAAANLLLATLVITHMVQPWHILATALVAGTAQAFQQPARQALVSDLVEEKYIANAIALNSVAHNTSHTLGPMLAGALVAFVGAAGSYFFQAAIYIIATIWTAQMVVPPNNPGNGQASMRESFMEGMRYIKSDKTILILMVMALLPPLLEHPYISLMPIFAKDILQVGPQGLGALMAAVGLGSISGALLTATVFREQQKGALLLVNALVFGVFLGLFAFTPWFVLALPILVVTGATQTAYSVLNTTLIQTLTPRHLRGRVMGVYFLDRGTMLLGTLLAGTMASAMGAPLAVGILATFGILVPLWIAISVPRIRHLE